MSKIALRARPLGTWVSAERLPVDNATRFLNKFSQSAFVSGVLNPILPVPLHIRPGERHDQGWLERMHGSKLGEIVVFVINRRH